MTKNVMIDGRRYDLRGMTKLDYSTRYIHGVRTVAVYYGPRSHRLIVQSDSQWEDRRHPGCCVGPVWTVYEPGTDDYGHFVETLEHDGCTLPDDVPVETIVE